MYDVPNRSHYLNQIIDPLNRPAVRSEYQEDGRLKKIIDVDGDPVEFVYDPANSTQTVKDSLGNPTLYEYDSRGNVIQQVNALGHSTQLKYDENNNVIQATDANGNIANYTYDSDANLLSRTEFHHPDETNPEITRYTYNKYGQNTSITLPTGATFSREYDAAGNLLAMLDSDGNAIQSYVYDQYGRIVEESDPTGTSYYGDFDAFGNPRWTKDASGEETTMTYDARGQLVSMTDSSGTSTFQYDGRGRQTRADYGDGIWVEYGYGAEQDWTSLDAPTIGHIERRFTLDGKLGGWLTPGGGEIVFKYDKAGRLEQEIDPSGQVTRYIYDKLGRVERVIDESTGLETINHYDSLVGIDPDPGVGDNLIGRQTGSTVKLDADTSLTTSSTYHPSGEVKTSTDPRNNTWHYSSSSTTSTVTDPLGRQTTTVRSPEYLPIETIYADGTRESAEYLYNNNLQEAKDYPTVITDRGGNDRHFTYDELGRLQAATDLGSTQTTYQYGDNGLSKVISPTSQTLLDYDYNSLGDLEKVTYLDGSTRELTYYETDNRIKTEKLPSGVTVDYEYDSAGLETRRVSSLDGEVTTNWDSATGSILSVTDSTGTTTYNYDPDTGSFEGLDYPNGGSIRYDRDILGRVEKTIVKAGPDEEAYTTEYEYDAAGNLERIIDPNLGETVMVYDAVNRLVERTLPNGVKTNYIYKENTDYTEKIEHLAPDGTVLSSMEYDRAASGEPTKIVREDGSYLVLDYDESLRVKSETYYDAAGAEVDKIEYEYDAAGNRQAVSSGHAEGTYSYDNVHQLTEIQTASGTESYSYDAGGRVETVVRDGETLRLEYNTDDQLVRVTDGDGNLVVEYSYDSSGRRVEATDSTGERDYIVAPTMGDGLESPHLVTDGNGDVVSGYVYAGDRPLMRLDENGNPIYYLTDAMGSVIGLVDENGEQVGSFLYDSFGNLRESEGSLIVVPEALGDFRFQGQWLESNTDFYNFRARYYDPETGRFISRDPVEIIEMEPESGNPYQFVYNNPHVYSDPTGLFTISEINVSTTIQNVLNSMRANLLDTAKQEAIDAAQGVVGDLISHFISTLIPITPAYGEVVDEALNFTGTGQRSLRDYAGNLVEEFIIDQGVCPILGAAGLSRYLWRETSITRKGHPKHDGRQCGEGPLIGRPDRLRRDLSKPDFIISSFPPTRLNTFRKAWLVGDIKAQTHTVENSINSNQWKAIRRFARKHQYVPSVLYITFFGSNDGILEQQIQAEALAQGLILRVLPLINS